MITPLYGAIEEREGGVDVEIGRQIESKFGR